MTTGEWSTGSQSFHDILCIPMAELPKNLTEAVKFEWSGSRELQDLRYHGMLGSYRATPSTHPQLQAIAKHPGRSLASDQLL